MPDPRAGGDTKNGLEVQREGASLVTRWRVFAAVLNPTLAVVTEKPRSARQRAHQTWLAHGNAKMQTLSRWWCALMLRDAYSNACDKLC